MGRIITAIVLSLLAHVFVLSSINFDIGKVVGRPETMMVKLVQVRPEPEILETSPVEEIEAPVPSTPIQSERETISTVDENIDTGPAADETDEVEMSSGIHDGSEQDESAIGDGNEPLDNSPSEEIRTPTESGNGTDTPSVNPPDEPEPHGPDLDSIRADYASDALRLIARHKEYPAVARRLGQEGDVGVRFSVDANGNVSNVVVEMSSGVSSLDEAAVDAVNAASPLGSIPLELGVESLTLTLTIIFTLD